MVGCEGHIEEILKKIEVEKKNVISNFEITLPNKSNEFVKYFNNPQFDIPTSNNTNMFLNKHKLLRYHENCSAVEKWMNIPASSIKCFLPHHFDYKKSSLIYQSKMEGCLRRRINNWQQYFMHVFPRRLPNKITCLKGLTPPPRIRSSVRYFPVSRSHDDSKERKISFEEDVDNPPGEGEVGYETKFHHVLNFIVWHKIFTFIDFLILVKRVTSTFIVYKKFVMGSRNRGFESRMLSKQSRGDGAGMQGVGGTSGTSGGVVTCSVDLPVEATIRTKSIGVFEEREGDPVKTVLATVSLMCLTMVWGLMRNGDNILMMMSDVEMSSSEDITSEVLLERDFLRAYHRMTVFDLSQCTDSFVFLQEIKNQLIPMNRSNRHHHANTTHECLFNSCDEHYRQTNFTTSSSSPASVKRADSSLTLKSNFLDVISSVVMTTASFVMADLISGFIISIFMSYCCRRSHSTHYSTTDPRSFTFRTTIEKQAPTTQTDLKLLETHV